MRCLREEAKPVDCDALDLEVLNRRLVALDASERVDWAVATFAEGVALSSSFGAQAAVMLHLVTRRRPDIPVVLIDTGYLFAETYRFVDELTDRLGLNLKVYRAEHSPAWQESRHGRLWEQGAAGIERYNRINKVEPMQRALHELNAQAWLTGLRRQQSGSRRHLGVVGWQNGRLKVNPIVDWTDRDIYRYLERHDLPYHPLWHQGYVSLGDWHTSRPLVDGTDAEQTRFFGLRRECGLHEHV